MNTRNIEKGKQNGGKQGEKIDCYVLLTSITIYYLLVGVAIP